MATKVASSPSLPKSGAISKGYNFASTWDQSAPLTEEQQAAIVSLSHAVAERPFPANLVHEYVYRPEYGLSVSAEDTNLGDSGVIEVVLVNKNQKDLFDKECDTVGFASAFVFYKWFTDLELAMKSEVSDSHVVPRNYPTQVDETLDLFNELQLQHQTVTTKTKTLHDAFDRLLMEKQKLMEFAEALRSKLNYFDELENVQAAFRGTDGNKASVSEGVEASVIYVRFKAAASELKPVLEEIESRSARKEYVQILAECHRLYCDQRLSLVKGIVHQRVSEVSKKEALPSLTRSGCAYLMQVCHMEYQLFTHFFPASSEEVSSLAPLVDPLSTYLYDILRPKLIHEANIDLLCELVHILKVEVLGEQSARQSEPLDAVEVCSLSVQVSNLENHAFIALPLDSFSSKASKLVIKRSTTMDGQLFLIKHLLILREQIVPFDIEFSVTHKELDFSHLLELEKCLKTTCEEFIMSVTKLVVDPMLSFVTKVTAIKVALSTGTQNQKVDSVMAKPLKEQAFATPDKVAELVQKVYAAMQQELLPILAKMKLYLQNPSTRTILFKPIKTNIVEAHTQVESLLKAEYSVEEQADVNMISIQDLQTQLDNLL
ncbi:hypothetical protein YC2023_016913 [Brassica napus]